MLLARAMDAGVGPRSSTPHGRHAGTAAVDGGHVRWNSKITAVLPRLNLGANLNSVSR